MPVGGRIQLFLTFWHQITSDNWILEVVREGYALEFVGPPPPGPVRITPAGAKGSPVRLEVQALLKKKAIEPVDPHRRGGRFYSTFFLRPKKSGGLRPILNLRPLNKHLRAQYFKMDHLGSIVGSIKRGFYAVSLDLTDAYLHIPIRESHRRFLSFAISQSEHYQFSVLCFGLRTAPRVFTKVVSEIGAVMRRQGACIFQYLDDWLLLHRDKQVLENQLHYLLNLTLNLGFIVNWEKSDLSPSRQFTYLGVRFDLISGLLFPSEDRLLRLKAALRAVLVPAAEVGDWLHLLGIMASCIGIVPWARLRMRPLQLFLLSQWRPASRDIKAIINLPEVVKPHLSWWTRESNLLAGVPLEKPPAQLTMKTDACTSFGWGGYIVNGPFAQGKWSARESTEHINWLEMMAVWNCLREFQAVVTGKSILLQSDNMTVVHYVNKEGGTRSAKLCYLAWDLLLWCRENTVSIRAVHLAGSDNHLADLLSRKTISPLEWSLEDSVVNRLFHQLGRPHIDLFASHENAKLPTYCSWIPDPQALAIDALTLDWKNMLAYAFPPIALIQKVLDKVERDECSLLLIAPVWPRRHWYTQVLSLLCDLPILLPDRHDLLSQHRGRVYHPDPKTFQLAAWPLSGRASEREAFLKEQLNLSPVQSEPRQDQCIKDGSRSLLVGAINGTWIRFKRL